MREPAPKEDQMMTHYVIRSIDRPSPSPWMSIAATMHPRNQDSGRVLYDVTVADDRAEELEAALEADDDVLEYEVTGLRAVEVRSRDPLLDGIRAVLLANCGDCHQDHGDELVLQLRDFFLKFAEENS